MSREITPCRASIFGTVIRILVVTAVLLLVAGFFLGWFSFSTSREDSGDDSRIDMTISVNTGEIKRDAGTLKDRFTGLKDAADVAAKIQIVEGKVKSVDMTTGELVVQPRNSDKPATVKVDEETEFKLGDRQPSLAKLQEGDEVVVTYVKKDDVRRVKKISLLENRF